MTRTVERAIEKGYDEISIRQRTCQACGMLLDDAGEFHPWSFCIWKKAGLRPWDEFRRIALQLGLSDPGEKPRLVREIHS